MDKWANIEKQITRHYRRELFRISKWEWFKYHAERIIMKIVSVFICLCLLIALGGCVRKAEPGKVIIVPNTSTEIRSVSAEPPFGVSVITIDHEEYVVVRTKMGYGEGVAICKK